MINSGTENSRPPLRGPLDEAKAVSSPPSSLPSRAARLRASFSSKEAVGRHRLSQEQEGTSKSNGLTEPGSLSIPPICSGHRHCSQPTRGSAVGTSPKKPLGSAVGLGSEPAPPQMGVRACALGRCRSYSNSSQHQISPAALPCSHICRAQGGTNHNTALLTAFIGKEIIKGKSLLGKEIDGGIPSPFIFLPTQLRAMFQQHSMPRRGNYCRSRAGLLSTSFS